MAAVAPPRMSAQRRREARAGYFFIFPWILSLLVFTAYPVIASFYLSFTDYTILEPPKWVGLTNFRTMSSIDPSFSTAVYNSAYYALISVPLGLVVSLGLAMILNMRATGIGVYRTLFYLPALAPPVAGAIIFVVMFNSQGGLVNQLLGAVGLPTPAWFSDPTWAKPGLIILSLWGVGVGTLTFLAGLKDIPQSLLEAANIDGANALQRFRHITLPLLTPVTLFNLVMGVINSFQVFTQAIVIGGTTGKPLESTLMYMVLIYRNAFRYFKMGYASALSVLLFLAVLIITLTIFRSARLWVFQENDEAGV
ncbi:MAG TPA: sugar ABC transporter permease [Caldilineaceae bacterium]|nr:sugar ABC transporter permease [Caldilineaceae bacterium]